jgi:hypothetical protein
MARPLGRIQTTHLPCVANYIIFFIQEVRVDMLAALRQLPGPAWVAPGIDMARAFSSAPSVYDYLIRFHVIDMDGKKHTIKGLAGKSVATAMHKSGHFNSYDDFCYGPGIAEPDTHVYASNELSSQLGKITDEEKEAISQCAADVRAK